MPSYLPGPPPSPPPRPHLPPTHGPLSPVACLDLNSTALEREGVELASLHFTDENSKLGEAKGTVTLVRHRRRGLAHDTGSYLYQEEDVTPISEIKKLRLREMQ